MLSNWLVRYSQ